MATMRLDVIVFGVLVIVLWGVWGFTAKLASVRIGPQVLIWYLLASNVLLIGYLAFLGRLWPINPDPAGIGLGLAVGVSASLGTILFYLILAAAPTSLIIPLTALYPAVTAILGFWALGEPFSVQRVIGIGLAVLAIFFLSQ